MDIRNASLPLDDTHFCFAGFLLSYKEQKGAAAVFHPRRAGYLFMVLLSLIQQYMSSSGMLLNNTITTVTLTLGVLLFIVGYTYSKPDTKLNSKLYLLLLIPFISSIFLWTNEMHHLFYVKYSDINSERVRGPIAYVINYINIGFTFTAMFFLIRSTVRIRVSFRGNRS
jgi:hypothetical protein